MNEFSLDLAVGFMINALQDEYGFVHTSTTIEDTGCCVAFITNLEHLARIHVSWWDKSDLYALLMCNDTINTRRSRVVHTVEGLPHVVFELLKNT